MLVENIDGTILIGTQPHIRDRVKLKKYLFILFLRNLFIVGAAKKYNLVLNQLNI